MIYGVVIVNLARIVLPLVGDDRLNSTAAWTYSELSPRRPRLAIRGYSMQLLIGWQDRKPIESAEVARRHDYNWPASWRLIEEDAPIISGVTAASENPLPFLRSEDAFAGKLPIQQVHFLALVAIGIHHDVFMLLTNTLNFL
jgi:hypothetical protein